MLLIEAILAALALILAFVRPTLGASWFERIEIAFTCLARRRASAIAMIGFSTLVLRIAVLPVEPIPQPVVHDEFSYLLQADTFAHGRLTNPTPPMWEHFETFHEIFQPTYCSKFFPGQGLFLALGQVVFGHPFWGVWLTSGLMCAAITWMLQGWFPPEWAFLGGALAVLRFGVFGYWADSYWGGNVPAIGGALVLGALPRIKSSQRMADAVLMGLGLALLANSRPWEGLVFSLPIAVILFSWMLGKNRPPLTISLGRVVLPLALVLGLTGAWLGYYCWRATGSPVRTPYQVYEQTYGAIPYMRWQHVRPEPVYRHAILRKLDIEQELAEYKIPLALHVTWTLFSAFCFFLGPALLIPFLLLFVALPYGFSFRDIHPQTRALLVILVASILGTEMAVFYNPHYSAPAIGLILALVLGALRRVRHSGQFGLFMSRSVPFLCLLVFGLRVFANPLNISKSQKHAYYRNEFFQLHTKDWFPRAEIQSELQTMPGNQLVFVRYDPKHEPFPEWVYNDADVEHSRIIWARDMDQAQNQELLDYYKHRQAWLLEADAKPPQLSPYVNHSASQLVAPVNNNAPATEAK